MISGDHLLGRTVLFFDYGHTPDPFGEFLASLDAVEPLEVDLCLPGHGRTVPRPGGEDRRRRGARPASCSDRVRAALAGEAEPTAFEMVEAIVGRENLNAADRRLRCCRSSSPASTTWPLLGEAQPVAGHRPAALALRY